MLVVRLGFLGCSVWMRQAIREDLERGYLSLLGPVGKPAPRYAPIAYAMICLLARSFRESHREREGSTATRASH